MPDPLRVSPAVELGRKNPGAGAGAKNAQVEHKNQLVHNGNAAHGQCAHLADHNVIQQRNEIGNAILNDNWHGDLEHAPIKRPVADVLFEHRSSS